MRKSILPTIAGAVGMTMLFQQCASAKTNQCRTMWTSCIEDRCVNQPNDFAARQACTRPDATTEETNARGSVQRTSTIRTEGAEKTDLESRTCNMVTCQRAEEGRSGGDPVRPPKPPVGAQPPAKAPLSTGTWTPPSQTPPPPGSPVKDPAPKTPPARELLTKPYGGTYRP